MIKAFAFDLDGLLIDSEPVWEKASSMIIKEFNVSWGKEDQERTTGISVLDCAQYMSTKINNNIAPLKIHEMLINNMVELFDKGISPMPGANELLNLLSAFPKALASSSPKKIISMVLDKMNWGHFFSEILSGNEIQNGKPAPDIYNLICERFKINPQELVVFEDSTNGILSAYNAHAKIISVPNSYVKPLKGVLLKADLLLNSLEDFSMETLDLLS